MLLLGRRQNPALIIPPAQNRPKALLTRLAAECQVIAGYRPLALGIHLALQAATPGTSKKLIRRALAFHCGQRRYLEALVAGGVRYALDGSIRGVITEPQREIARAKLAKAKASKPAVVRTALTPPHGRAILSLPKRREP